jgi:hypothetical protein
MATASYSGDTHDNAQTLGAVISDSDATAASFFEIPPL